MTQPRPKAGALEAQSAYETEAFAEWRHEKNNNTFKTKGPDGQYYNTTERTGLRQRTPTGAVVSGAREWTHGVEKT